MITYKDFYLLWENAESPFEGITPSKLGFHNTILDLPDEKPYGFWVDKHGNFIVADTYSHTHIRIVRSIFYKILELTGRKESPQDAKSLVYGFLFKNGCVRVVIGGDFLYYQTYTMGQITGAQMKFLNFVKDLYNLNQMGFDKALQFD